MPMIQVDGLGEIQAEAGRKLVLALEDGGIDVSHRCGGVARCTTCRIELLEGTLPARGEAEAARLAQEANLAENIRLSCQVRVPEHDLKVRVLVRASEKNWDPGTRPAED